MSDSDSNFRVIFTDENRKPVTVYAKEVTSSMLGFIEISQLFFPDISDIIVTPDDDKVSNMFKNVKTIYLPINQIVRIDELNIDKKAPVISIVNKDENNKNE